MQFQQLLNAVQIQVNKRCDQNNNLNANFIDLQNENQALAQGAVAMANDVQAAQAAAAQAITNATTAQQQAEVAQAAAAAAAGGAALGGAAVPPPPTPAVFATTPAMVNYEA